MQFQGGQLECPAHIKNEELVDLMKRIEEQYEKPVALQRDYQVVSQMHDDLVHKGAAQDKFEQTKKRVAQQAYQVHVWSCLLFRSDIQHVKLSHWD